RPGPFGRWGNRPVRGPSAAGVVQVVLHVTRCGRLTALHPAALLYGDLGAVRIGAARAVAVVVDGVRVHRQRFGVVRPREGVAARDGGAVDGGAVRQMPDLSRCRTVTVQFDQRTRAVVGLDPVEGPGESGRGSGGEEEGGGPDGLAEKSGADALETRCLPHGRSVLSSWQYTTGRIE